MLRTRSLSVQLELALAAPVFFSVSDMVNM
jgi:hypothetical protein